MTSGPVQLPPPPPQVREIFGDREDLATHFAGLLATSGVDHGLVGPREVPRLWDRHVLNCAVVADLIRPEARVVDVGSGAGLPGLVLAIARPDVEVVLVEPLLRRTTWLEDAVEELGLDNASIRRGKAEAFWGELTAPYVTARAVARIGTLAGWCLPLLEPHGRLLALKGASAGDELEAQRDEVRSAGAVDASVGTCGDGVVDPPTTVVTVRVGESTPRPSRSSGGSASRRAKRRRRRD